MTISSNFVDNIEDSDMMNNLSFQVVDGDLIIICEQYFGGNY